MPIKVTPLSEIDRHVREAGRIRMGIKTVTAKGKPSMEATGTFRFTSQHKHLLDELATHYGGTVKPWHDDKANPRDQFQLQSEVDRVPVLLIPDGISTWYELWGGRGNQRRCDGITCTVPEPDGYDLNLVEKPCLCAEAGKLTCKRHTRIAVLLPVIAFEGSWRLESKGKAASEELPGMYALISAVVVRGRMVEAVLGMESREMMTEAGPRHFVVPYLAITESPKQLAAGGSTLAIGSGPVEPPTMQVGVGYGTVDLHTDNEPIEAEVIEDGQLEAEEQLCADARNFGLPEDAYVAAVKAECMIEGRLSVKWMNAISRRTRAEEIEPLGFSQGLIKWKTNTTTKETS